MDIAELCDVDLHVTAVDFAYSKQCPPGWTLHMTRRSMHCLVLITEGSAQYHFGDEVVCGEKSDIIYLKKGDCYTTRAAANGLSFIAVSFDASPADAMEQMPLAHLSQTSRPLRFAELFRQTQEIWVAKTPGSRMLAAAMIQILLYELLQEVVQRHFGTAALTGIRATADYMENRFHCVITIRDLAHMCGYSPAYFRKKFKEIYGIAPIAYLNKTRIEKAKGFLRSGLYSVGEVARLCGFDNVYYFSKVFKKLTGVSPGRY